MNTYQGKKERKKTRKGKRPIRYKQMKDVKAPEMNGESQVPETPPLPPPHTETIQIINLNHPT